MAIDWSGAKSLNRERREKVGMDRMDMVGVVLGMCEYDEQWEE